MRGIFGAIFCLRCEIFEDIILRVFFSPCHPTEEHFVFHPFTKCWEKISSISGSFRHRCPRKCSYSINTPSRPHQTCAHLHSTHLKCLSVEGCRSVLATLRTKRVIISINIPRSKQGAQEKNLFILKSVSSILKPMLFYYKMEWIRERQQGKRSPNYESKETFVMEKGASSSFFPRQQRDLLFSFFEIFWMRSFKISSKLRLLR